MTTQYDLIVIGSGPGGTDAASFAASRGLKVALIEKREWGGTCLNRGCIPTKALLHSAHAYHQLKNVNEFGVNVEQVGYSLHTMQQHKNSVIQKIRDDLKQRLSKEGVELIHGSAKINAPHIVEVNGRLLHTKNILIASGSRPRVIEFDGLAQVEYMTSDELLEYNNDIQHLIIVGGGVIGCEFAQMMAMLDVEVTIIEVEDNLLSVLDKEIGQSIKLQFKKSNIHVLTSAQVKKITPGVKIEVDVKGKTEIVEGSHLLMATGRRANVENIVSDDLNIQIEHSRIVVNENFETSIPSIYAIGDVLGRIQLAHEASAQGVNAVCHMINQPMHYQVETIPSCVYTHPEIASVGKNLKKAKEENVNAMSVKVVSGANAKNLLSNQPRGFVKLVFDSYSQQVIGADLMCERATDMICLFTQAINSKLTLKELSKSIYAHPTFSEMLKEVIELALSKCKA